MTVTANQFQTAMLKAYPVEDLSFDVSDIEEIDRVVKADEIGDTLFAFLWRELHDAASAAEARQMMDSAIQQLENVRKAMSAIEDEEGVASIEEGA
jgi:hypothetical protein